MGFIPNSFLSSDQRKSLEETVISICTRGKGITACDESAGTIGKRFGEVGLENCVELRRSYRQILLCTKGIEEYLSAAILDPETLLQKDDKGVLFPESLSQRNIITGVKPHLKVYTLPNGSKDTVMQGLDGLASRCATYYRQGARFAKWRSPLVISMSTDGSSGQVVQPTRLAINANMTDLARVALICQSEGLVPMVEPDVSLQGNHTLEVAASVNIDVLSTLFRALQEHGVYLPGVIVKTNMVNPGKECPLSYSAQDIAQANHYVLEQALPLAIRGVNYLSGGQSLEQALERLHAINNLKLLPWNLSFSWSQALQIPLLGLARGKDVLPATEMAALYLRELNMASLASKGQLESRTGEGDHTGIDRKRKR